jgi:hypothetical protein
MGFKIQVIVTCDSCSAEAKGTADVVQESSMNEAGPSYTGRGQIDMESVYVAGWQIEGIPVKATCKACWDPD